MNNETQKSALLVMDVQPGIVDRLPNKDEYLTNISAAIATARAKQIPVIYVVVGFRAGFPEVSAQNKSFGAIKESAPAGMVNPQPAVTVAEGEVVVTKRRVSAFTGSDLEVVLRGQDVRHLVLTGIATSGVVLSTVREAADKDYKLTVISDLCADFDPQVHSTLIEKVFPRQADIMTAQEWMSSL